MITYILFGTGIILLIKGADYLVDGSSSLAKKFKVPTIVIGLTIVAFGTSMPELVVNIASAIRNSGDIAFGNIVGSNIVNILLILGISGIIGSLKVQSSTVWKEIPFSLLAVIVLVVFANAHVLDKLNFNSILKFEGIVLVLFFIIFLYYVFGLARKNKLKLDDKKIEIKKYSGGIIFLMIIGGLIALYFGGKWTVDGAILIARAFGLSEYFIGLTIVAVGTSLPELVTSIVAAIKKQNDLAVGNIVGSNIFNIFWILGLTAIINPIVIPVSANIDLLVLLVATVLLFVFMFLGKRHELDRWQGIMFVIMYVVYVVYLTGRG
ncbi:MAG: calcium/sodium antiporter [Candidatus Portnoybacteria bacterium]|jgi:cation:H+ antiporter|nr:calcium/sodium antiporter [Candidatus Portnoybacteria bacterium]MDD5752414.1 calcium/sodium antiporter [Candidatus Portnoybacteria bacterium]